MSDGMACGPTTYQVAVLRPPHPASAYGGCAAAPEGRRPGEGAFLPSQLRRHLSDVPLGIPPPFTPPLKGEGDSETSATPSPLWGGVRGGGISAQRRDAYGFALAIRARP